eukprot:CAMPEP_0183308132 /NCGR_PEP_ID=MMETSP0160_2-20130417/20002_1 /TAXON_ID=2839 ORGANISM="Odontella Sinensis, Strain Grunow 1884" /NCGR_SAMPLE_ID=MMETSP0160_2 /ASSEMBLY_ACC=CAM_ASM_000250 /LENGTH=66 /DNA_ID=CAMNT_0025471891 /DNA_START=99 /DNA_END=296 /DNA_ORIENTATION=-
MTESLLRLLGPERALRLAFAPHTHDDETIRLAFRDLFDPSASLLDRGLALWIVGRVLQIDEGAHGR